MKYPECRACQRATIRIARRRGGPGGGRADREAVGTGREARASGSGTRPGEIGSVGTRAGRADRKDWDRRQRVSDPASFRCGTGRVGLVPECWSGQRGIPHLRLGFGCRDPSVRDIHAVLPNGEAAGGCQRRSIRGRRRQRSPAPVFLPRRGQRRTARTRPPIVPVLTRAREGKPSATRSRAWTPPFTCAGRLPQPPLGFGTRNRTMDDESGARQGGPFRSARRAATFVAVQETAALGLRRKPGTSPLPPRKLRCIYGTLYR